MKTDLGCDSTLKTKLNYERWFFLVSLIWNEKGFIKVFEVGKY